jgi:hypothetical protein
MVQQEGRGGEYLEGLFFMVGVGFICLSPRMPSDPKHGCTIGGRISFPFRRAFLALVVLAMAREMVCHLVHDNSIFFKVFDGVLGTMFTVGQCFMCMTTAYLLQDQLTAVISIQPGQDLIPYLTAVFAINVTGITLSHWVHPNFCALISLAEAVSSIPVLKTLQLYATVTTHGGQHAGRGTALTQVLKTTEYWYIFSSIVAFFAEVNHRKNVDALELGWTDELVEAMGHQQDIGVDDFFAEVFHRKNVDALELGWMDELVEAMRHQQDIGVDDWTRLLVHSIFLNCIDELSHFSAGDPPSSTRSDESTSSNMPGDAENVEGNELILKKRSRIQHDVV